MKLRETDMSRREFAKSVGEFVKRIATKSVPFLLALGAVWVGFSVYRILDSSTSGFEMLLLTVLLLLFTYPTLKRRYGQRVWNRLPRLAKPIALGLKIMVSLLTMVFMIGFLVLLGLYMPLLLVLFCLYLLVEIGRLRGELEDKEYMTSQGVDMAQR